MSGSSQGANRPVAVVLGVGPGLGSAVAQRFAREGYALGLMARGRDKLDPVAEAIEGEGGTALAVPADATDADSVQDGFRTVREQLGDPEVLVYNAGAFEMGGILEISAEDFDRCWRANCYGAFVAAREVLPRMVERGRGTVLLTGATAALRGGARFANLAVGKFGLRALAQSLAREFQPQGIHVTHVIVDGQIDTPKLRRMQPDREAHTMLDPDGIAETYWQLHVQDRSAWTQELDVRPHVETF